MPDNGFDGASDPVAIVGMALEAPGGIDTADKYWELLSHGREALGPFPTDRGWQVGELLAGSRRSGFKEIHDRGGFLCGATTFDPEFFGISPREAVAMDPQQRPAVRWVGMAPALTPSEIPDCKRMGSRWNLVFESDRANHNEIN